MTAFRSSRLLLVALLVCTTVSAAGLAGCADDEPADTVGRVTESADAPGTQQGTESASATATTTVSLYFAYVNGASLGVPRDVADTPNLALQVASLLVAGPTDTERQTWPLLHSEIPAGTRVLGVEVADGVAAIDLSDEFDSGGGSASMIMRVAQVVYTLTGVPGIDAVEFYVEGERIEALGGEGLMLEEPQTPEDYEELVPIEA